MTSYSVDWYHQVPPHVKEILASLQNAGFEAFIVGGAVRDLWLGKLPHDYDLVSSASVEDIARIFPKTLDIGKAFGIMVVVTDDGPVEVARFRTDGDYTDKRHPTSVQFTNPEEDAKRRDFTINALFYDPAKKEVRDYVGGIKDLNQHVLRTVGEPEKRFKEDALRMLRAIRFHTQLEFTLEPSILHAITKLSTNLSAVSRERITQEMEKIFLSARPFLGLRDLFLTGLWEEVFQVDLPELKDLEELERLETISVPLHGVELYLSAVQMICPNFKASPAFTFGKEITQRMAAIADLKKQIILFGSLDLYDKKNILHHPNFAEAWSLLFIKNPSLAWLEDLPALKEEWKDRLNPEPLITGKDLIAAGIQPGPEMKNILELVRRAQLNEEISSKEEAIKLARNWAT